jgi:MYXO-CTERM domain-containing protein
VKCQAEGSASCQADLKASCNTKCDTQGVVVCDGVIQDFVDDVNAAAAWVDAHVTYKSSSSAGCSGNECHAEASAEAKTNCATSPGPAEGGLAVFGGAFALGLVGVARRRTKRSGG